MPGIQPTSGLLAMCKQNSVFASRAKNDGGHISLDFIFNADEFKVIAVKLCSDCVELTRCKPSVSF
jgi:hypothetical protein